MSVSVLLKLCQNLPFFVRLLNPPSYRWPLHGWSELIFDLAVLSWVLGYYWSQHGLLLGSWACSFDGAHNTTSSKTASVKTAPSWDGCTFTVRVKLPEEQPVLNFMLCKGHHFKTSNQFSTLCFIFQSCCIRRKPEKSISSNTHLSWDLPAITSVQRGLL